MFRRNILLKETGPEHHSSTKFIAPEAKKWIKERLGLHVTNLKELPLSKLARFTKQRYIETKQRYMETKQRYIETKYDLT